jgi:hypothetical protein
MALFCATQNVLMFNGDLGTPNSATPYTILTIRDASSGDVLSPGTTGAGLGTSSLRWNLFAAEGDFAPNSGVPAFNLGSSGTVSSPSTGNLWWDGTNLKFYTSSTKTFLWADLSNISGTLGLANGGTNSTAAASAGSVVYSTASAYAFTAVGSSNQVLISNGTSAPSWATLSTIGIGGTIANTQVAYGSGANTIQGSSVFTYTSGNLGIGIATALARVHSYGGDIAVDSVNTLTAGRLTYINAAGNYGTRTNSTLSAAQIFGRVVNQNPDLLDGTTGYARYDNSAGGHTTLTLVADSTNLNCPNSSGNMFSIAYDGLGTPGTNPTPGYGGFYISFPVGAGTNGQITGYQYKRGSRIRYRVFANIPSGYNITFGSNSTGTGAAFSWISSTAGTGNWYLYEGVQHIGETGSYGTTGYFYIGSGGPNSAFTWYVASCVLIDEDAVPAVSSSPNLNVGYYAGANQGFGDFLATGTVLLTLSATPKVGVGLVSPAQKLHVNAGNVRVDQVAVPGAATVATGAAGSLTGTYTYAVTFTTALGETGLGTASGSVSPSSQQVSITNIPLGNTSTPDGVTGRKIYRTKAGGTTYFLLTTIADNTTTTYTDNTVDGSLGATDSTFRLNTTGGFLYSGTYRVLMSDQPSSTVAIGGNAIPSTATGGFNTAVGTGAGSSLTTSQSNALFGAGAGANLTIGGFNVLMGRNALNTATSAGDTVAVGYAAGFGVTLNSQNVFVGSQSGYRPGGVQANATTTGSSNTFIGYESGQATSSQINYSIALGNYSLVTSSNQAAIGGMGTTYAVNLGLATNNPGQRLDIGYGHLRFTQLTAPTAPSVAVGASGNPNGTYTYAVTFVTAQGETSLGTVSSSVSPVSQQVSLTAIPTDALGYATSRKIYRTLAGGSKYYLLTTLADNVTTTYTDNTADGSLGTVDYTLRGNTTASQLYVGTSLAGQINASNTAIGINTLNSITGGSYNVALGYSALGALTIATQTTAIGHYAGSNMTQASGNVFVGYAAGSATNPVTTGGQNTFIGSYTGPATSTQFNNSIAIGYNATVTAASQAVMGPQGAQAVNFGVGTNNPQQRIDIGYGHQRFTTLAAPGAPTLALGSAGVLTGTYYYMVTYVTANGETNAGTVSASISPSSQQVSITAIPTDTIGYATARKIYRTAAGGATTGPFYLLTTIADNVTTTYTDNTADGSLGTVDYTSRDNTTAGIIYFNTVIAGFTGQNSASTSWGYSALASATGAFGNSAFGWNALHANTTGGSNSAFGQSALIAVTTSGGNSAFGYASGLTLSTGSGNNSFFGSNTGRLVTGGYNTFIGGSSGYSPNAVTANATTTGASNTFIGYQTGAATSTQTSNSIAIGVNAVVTNSNQAVIGAVGNSFSVNLGIATSSPAQRLDVGYGHLRFTQLAAPGAPTVATGAAGVLTGNYYYVVTFVTTQGETNAGTASSVVAPSSQQVSLTAIPTDPLGYATSRKIYRTKTGGVNTGPFFFLATIGDNTTTTYTDNTADGSLPAGDNTYRENTTGGLLFIGTVNAGIAGITSTAFGQSSFASTNIGFANSAFGKAALNANTTGVRNTALGYSAMTNNTTGGLNTAVGYAALNNNITGSQNAAFGQKTLFANTGTNNTAFGYQGLTNSLSGGSLTALGSGALQSVLYSSNTIGIGYNADILVPASGFGAAATSGAGMGTGAYAYFVTFAINGVETSPNITPVTVTTTGGNNQVNLTSLPLYTGSYAATRNIYRTKVGGNASSTFYLLTNIGDNTTTTYTDSTADSSLVTTYVAQGASISLGSGATALYAKQLVVGSNTGGAITDVFIGNDVYAASPQALTLHSTGGLGTNIAGANLIMSPGQGTGTAAGGYFSVQTAAAGGSSGAIFNSATERFRIDSTGLTSVKGSFNAGSAAQMTIDTSGNIGTSGGYTQTGSTANTFSGATTFTATGTALTVNNNATVSGLMGVGTGSAATTQLSVSANWGTSPVDQSRGMNLSTTLSPSSTFNGSYGFTSNATIAPSGGITAGYIYSNFAQAFYAGTGSSTLTALAGGYFRTGMSGVSPTGTVGSAYGFYIDPISNQATGSPSVTFTNQYGVYIQNQGAGSGSGGLTITNAYGIYIASVTGAVTNNYALYSAGGAVYIKGAVTLDANGTGLTVTNNIVVTSGNLTVGTIYGSASSAGTLTLGSTSNATKGKINFGSTSVFDEANVRLGLNITTPAQRLEVQAGHMRFNQLGAPIAATIAYTGTGLTGTWYYRVSYVTAYGETHLGTVSAQASPSNQTVVLTIPVDATGTATGRNIYRTLTAGATTGPFYLLTSIGDNTTTTYNDSTADGSLGVIDYTNRDNTTSGRFYQGTTVTGQTGFGNGNGNTIWGYGALASVTGGYATTAIGLSSLASMTIGSSNVGVGHNTLSSLTTGSNNIAIGANAGSSLISNGANLFIGRDTGRSVTSANNVMIGHSAGYLPNNTSANATTTGAGNTFIGILTGAATSTQINTSIAIGQNAIVTGSNQAVIGGTSSYAVKVGINNANPNTAQLSLVTDAIGTIGILVNGVSGQTADLQDWQVNGSNILALSAGGTLTFNADSSATLSRSTTATLSVGGSFVVTTNLTVSTFTQGSVVFSGASGLYSQNNSYFFWDNASKRLGLGTSTPAYRLSIATGHLQFQYVGNPTAVTVATGAAGVLTGNYYYAITYVTSLGESRLGTVSSVVAPSSQQVSLSAIPVSTNADVTSKNIYRTLSGGASSGPFYLVANISAATTTYSDNIADGSLGATDVTNRDNTTSGNFYVNGTAAGYLGFTNTSFGYLTLIAPGASYANVAFGVAAGQNLTSGSNFNVLVGWGTGQNLTAATGNIVMGQSLTQATSTTRSVLIGHGSFQSGTGSSGSDSATLGYGTGSSATGNHMVLVGSNAGHSLSNGSGNIFVGYQSGYSPNGTSANATTSGANNVFVGYQAGAATSTQISTSIAIGYLAIVTGSNQAVIGGTGGNAVKVGINNNNPSTAQLSLVTDAIGTIGILVNGASGQTSNLQNWAVNGTVLASINASGNLLATSVLTLNGSSSGFVSFTSPSAAGSQAYTLPTAYPGVSGYVLSSTTSGTMSWVAPPAGSIGGSVGSSVDTDVLFINSGNLAEDATFTFNYTNKTLNLTGTTAAIPNLIVTKTALTTTSTPGIQISNTTASTSGVPQQQSPAIDWIAHVWNTTVTAADNTARFRNELQVTSGATPTSLLVWKSSIDTGTASFTNVMTLTNGGTLTVAGGLTIASLTGVLTASSGVVSASAQLSVALGGTGIGSYTAGDMLYATGSTTLTKLGIGATNGAILMSNGSSAPSWATTIPTTITFSNGLTISGGTFTLNAAESSSLTTTSTAPAHGHADVDLYQPSGAPTTDFYAYYQQIEYANNQASTFGIAGFRSDAMTTAALTSATVARLDSFLAVYAPSGAGTVSQATGIRIIQSSALSGTTTNYMGVRIEDSISSGTVTHSAGIYVDTIGGAGGTSGASIYMVSDGTAKTGISWGTSTSNYTADVGIFRSGAGAITITGTATITNGLTVSAGTLTFTGVSGVLTASAGVVSGVATLGVALGGTNIASYSTGDILYASGSTTLSKLGIGSTNGAILMSNGSSAPSWSTSIPTLITFSSGLTISAGTITFTGFSGVVTASGGVITSSATLGVALGGTNLASYSTGDILYASGSTTLSKLGIGSTNGAILMSNGSSAPSWATSIPTLITFSSGLTISSGTITFTGFSGVVTASGGVITSSATLGVALGGTNIASYTAGDMLYATGSTTLAKLGIGATNGAIMMSNGSSAPSWVTSIPALITFSAGITVTGAKTTLAATASGYASVNLPSGTAPSSPTSGDLWWDGTSLSFRTASSTVNLLTPTVTPAGSNTQIQFNDGGTMAGSANLTWNKSTNVETVNGTVAANAVTLNGVDAQALMIAYSIALG